MKIEIGPYPDDDSERKIDVQLDKFDTWNMDDTLAHIILPMLKQLKETKHGSHIVDDGDVPEELRTTSNTYQDHAGDQLVVKFGDDKEFEDKMWAQYEIRWNWVLGEMIWAFEQKTTNWDEQFYSGDPGKGFNDPNSTFTCDYDGMTKHSARMRNGFRLFGKYYEGLWD